MTAPQETEPVVAHILASELLKPDAFERDLNHIMELDMKYKAGFLTGLVERTMLKDGKTTLADEVRKQGGRLDGDEPTAAQTRFENLSKRALQTVSKKRQAEALVGARAFEFVLDEDKDVASIREVEYLNQSRAKNNAAQRVSDQTPYGPKQNDTSFRRRDA